MKITNENNKDIIKKSLSIKKKAKSHYKSNINQI